MALLRRFAPTAFAGLVFLGSAPGGAQEPQPDRPARHPEKVARLSEAIRHDSFKVRATAAVALGRLGDPAAVEPLSQALRGDNHFAVRAAAASALGRLQSASSVPPLLAALSDDDAFVQKEVKRGLERHYLPERLPGFEAGLSSDDADVRLACVRSFGTVLRSGHEDAALHVLAALADPEDEIRAAAESALDRVPHDRAVPMLERGLKEGETDVRSSAARMMAKRSDARFVQPLTEALARLGEQEAVRREVRGALKAHTSYIPVDEMRKKAASSATAQPDRVGALRLLAAISDPDAARLLKAGLTDGSREVRTASARAAADLATPEARAMLKSALRSEGDARVKKHIELVLRTMR